MSAVDTRKDWDGELLSRKGYSKLRVVEPTATRFLPLSLASVLALPPQRWLVDGLFPERGLTVIYGAPGSAKTFLVLDLAFRIAQGGGDWFGRATKGGSVVMVAGEGIHGLAGRCRAYCAHPQKMNPDADVDAALHVVPHPPNLFEGDADEFVASIASLRPTMVIIDTLSRSSVGADENSARDMGQVIAAADSIVKKLGCLVLLVHHARKGMSGGERGSSALRGAADAMFEIARKGDSGVRELVLSGGSAKMKDAAESESIFFRLEAVGESCVIVAADAPLQDEDSRPRPRGASQQLVYDLAGQALRERSGQVEGRPTITFAELLERWQGAVQDVRKREPGQLRRVLNPLIATGVLAGTDSAIWCT